MKISVAMCTYNGEKYIKEQLLSIFNQTRKVDEIVICDDGSKDCTVKICEDMLKNQCIDYKLIQNEASLKVLRNFEKSFSLCSGDIIFSCDQDDIWENNKVEVIMKEFEKNQHIDMVASNATLISGSGEKMNISLKESIGFSMNTNEEIINSLLHTFCITGATMAFRKEFQVKNFYLSAFWLHDGWLSLMAAMDNSFLYLDAKLTRYRLHGNNECGVGDVDILHHGTLQALAKRKEKRVVKTALTKPLYFEDFAAQKALMYEEVKTFIERHNLSYSKDNLHKLNTCISFWEMRKNLRYMKFMDAYKQIQYRRKKEMYLMYCESGKLAYFDLYFWFIYHAIPRRNRG